MPFCTSCGAENQPNVKFCTSCGAPMTTAETVSAPEAPQPQKPNIDGSLPKKVGFIEAAKRFFKNYAEFHGRATRSEYWYWFLAEMIISAILGAIFPVNEDGLSVGTVVWSLATLVPGIALYVRRLHDIGRHWTRVFIGLVPLAGGIIMLVDMCKASDGDNAWGPCAETCAANGWYEEN